jgi:hypothetical protein
MSDKLVYDLSQDLDGSPNIFVKKDWLNILDNQNGQYSSNQSVIDTSQLSNSNKYMSYREGYLLMPLLMTIATTDNTASANFSPVTNGLDYVMGLKNWYGSMIHSITLDYNGTTIIQQTPFCNMWNSFKLLTSMSWGDVATDGALIGFYPDDPDTWTFAAAVSPAGLGVCNNTNYRASGFGIPVTGAGAFNNFRAGDGNFGYLQRQTYINFDQDGLIGALSYTASSVFTSAAAQTLFQNYILTKTNGVNAGAQGVLQIAINAVIYLKHIHSFFMMTPLLKGVFMKMTLNLNNTTIAFTKGAANITLNSVSNAVGGVCPLMITSTVADNGGAQMGASPYRANVSVGGVCLDNTLSATATVTQSQYRNIILYVPAYTFNPVFESAYLSSPIKQIKYTDIYQYQISNVGAGTSINQLLTNGIASIKSVLLIPFYAGISNAAGNPLSVPEYQSPFDTAGCGTTAPMVKLTNFNVVVSGQNTLYNTQRYTFEEFANQLLGVNAVNGSLTDGLTSGLIDYYGFQQAYSYYYVDVSRMLPVEESVPKSVQIIGQNASPRSIDLWCFIEYGVDVSVDILTGARV